MHAPAKKAPRAASSYRGARRNAAKAARGLADWRDRSAYDANMAAGIYARAAVANGAREAAAAALVNNRFGMQEVTAAAAMLRYYCTAGVKRTRPVNRIIRELSKHVQSAAVRS
jgi:hypothetical protein